MVPAEFNGNQTKHAYVDYSSYNYTLGGGNAGDGFAVAGNLHAPSMPWIKNVQTFGTNKVTNNYWSGAYSGSFSGLGDDENAD